MLDSKFCYECGATFSDFIEETESNNENICPNCGNKVFEDDMFCGECGTKL